MKKSTFIYEFSNNKNLIMLHLITFKIAVLSGEDINHWYGNIYKLSPNKKRFLVSEKFLVEADDDTKLKNKAIKVLNSNEDSKRIEFDIYLTNKCNYRCTYCFQGDAKNKSYNKLSKAGIDNIFNSIDIIMSENKDKSYDFPVITLFGGEPLLPTNRDNLYYIFQKCEEKNIKYLLLQMAFI